jgi:hypothetical protein
MRDFLPDDGWLRHRMASSRHRRILKAESYPPDGSDSEVRDRILNMRMRLSDVARVDFITTTE